MSTPAETFFLSFASINPRSPRLLMDIQRLLTKSRDKKFILGVRVIACRKSEILSKEQNQCAEPARTSKPLLPQP